MKKEDLRIGNLVECTAGIGVVKEITKNGIFIEAEMFSDLFDEKYLNGILLSEDWLINFGFTDENLEGIFRLDTLKNVPVIVEHFVEVEYNCFSALKINCNTVNQLQNLFYLLNGEELKYKK